MKKPLKALFGAGSLALLLSACSPIPGEAESLSIKQGGVNISHSSPYMGAYPNMGDDAKVIDNKTISLTLYGSSSCPPTPMSAHHYFADGSRVVDVLIDTSQQDFQACTADYSPHTYILESNKGGFEKHTSIRISKDATEHNQSQIPNPYYTIDPIQPRPEPLDPDAPVESPTNPVEEPDVPRQEPDKIQNPDQDGEPTIEGAVKEGAQAGKKVDTW